MKILAHRGRWVTVSEKNTLPAFKSALDGGYGIETDFRDYKGDIVISHDPPLEGAINARDFLSLWEKDAKKNAWLAINIKADGLQEKLLLLLSEFSIDQYFVFDMSIPDTWIWHMNQVPFFSRQSEIEKMPVLLDNAKGIWLDSFESDWWDKQQIERHFGEGRHVCVVSPELHKRDYHASWERLLPLRNHPRLMLCTDRPDEARRFFDAED